MKANYNKDASTMSLKLQLNCTFCIKCTESPVPQTVEQDEGCSVGEW